MARIDYDAVAAGFEEGRGLAPADIAAWRTTLEPYLAPGLVRVADVGAGTGVFAWAFAHWFDADVVAIEPSSGMLREAAARRRHPAIAYASGRAEQLPLRDASCHAAWLSTVIHHIDDLRACAAELRRVLRPSAPVLIRSAFPGRTDHLEIVRWFPGARRVIDTFPSIEETAATFATAGFAIELVTDVPQTSAPGLRVFAERARRRADTTLLGISDDEFAEGLARLEAAAAAELEPQPIVDRITLFVLR
ncbi:MAG: class I SAM-dependent methyltransferase [Dehalococcoidia bacterium]|nr:MAG: class I SAM-dependent methyltransferase [Dehalococcoidia bacterium]